MPHVSVTVPHTLTQDEAQTRVQKLITDTREHYGSQLSDVHEIWTENSCDLGWKSMGTALSAILTVNPSDVNVESNLPMMFMAFKGRMETIVKERLGQALAP